MHLPSNYWAAVGSTPYALTVKSFSPAGNKPDPTAQIIKNILLKFFDVTEPQIKERNRTDKRVYVKQMICYVLYKYTYETYESIAKWMKLDHSTVMRSKRLVEGQLNTRWGNHYKDDALTIISLIMSSGIRVNPDIKK